MVKSQQRQKKKEKEKDLSLQKGGTEMQLADFEYIKTIQPLF
jgi:hypothetical protein